MGQLVSIIGNSGVGKTTLVELLAERPGFLAAKEDLQQRPFQALFARDLKSYALANQIDFLLYKAEQERWLRKQAGIGLQDGGLDQDYHIFTHLFFKAGYLDELEIELCGRLYHQLRQDQQPPDMYIYLECPVEVIAARYQARNREREITQLDDLHSVQSLLEKWLNEVEPHKLMMVNAGDDNYNSPEAVDKIAQQISEMLSE